MTLALGFLGIFSLVRSYLCIVSVALVGYTWETEANFLASGNVGLSLGYPTVSTSLCGMFGTFGKAVVCLMMIRGRHRGLPYALDRAIMLPTGQIAEN